MNEKLKNHWKENKHLYIGAGIGIVIAGYTYVIVRRTSVLDAKSTYWAHRTLESPPTGHSVSLFNSNHNIIHNKIVNVLERDSRGHPGYMIRCLETNTVYDSQKAAAIANNVHANHISDHLNGRLDHVDGKHYQRVFREEAA